jgi:hypothetical protein
VFLFRNATHLLVVGQHIGYMLSRAALELLHQLVMVVIGKALNALPLLKLFDLLEVELGHNGRLTQWMSTS